MDPRAVNRRGKYDHSDGVKQAGRSDDMHRPPAPIPRRRRAQTAAVSNWKKKPRRIARNENGSAASRSCHP